MYIKVRVLAGVNKEELLKLKDDTFEVRVKDKAKNNAANKRVLEIIAQKYSVPVSYVRILNGHQSPSKLISIRED